MSKREEFTIDEIMQDSMIRLLLKADRVDPIAFEAKLRAIATKSARQADLDVDDEADEELLQACATRGESCRQAPPGMIRS